MRSLKSLFVFRRDLRLTDNTALINADKAGYSVIPCFIFDPKQLNNKYKSNNCIQFMIESLTDLNEQLALYGSRLYTFYGHPWDIIRKIIKSGDIHSVFVNQDYSVYSKYRDKKIKEVCDDRDVNFIQYEDILLNDVNEIKTKTGEHYKKFTPYYRAAQKNRVEHPAKYHYRHLIKKYIAPIATYTNLNALYKKNDNLYIRGGRNNAKKILRNIANLHNYDKTRDFPVYDTTLLSPHNKFGTVSIREVYHAIRQNIRGKKILLRELYWRDFYYNQMHFEPDYFKMNLGKYSNIVWKNDTNKWKQWKSGNTGIPIVDAGMRQLNETGWIHNRIRMIVATVLTKIFLIDWRKGEKYFRTKLVDYDVSQNLMNWYWVSGEAPFSAPYFRVMKPDNQVKKYDKNCEYITEWIDVNGNCLYNENLDSPVKTYNKMHRISHY